MIVCHREKKTEIKSQIYMKVFQDPVFFSCLFVFQVRVWRRGRRWELYFFSPSPEGKREINIS